MAQPGRNLDIYITDINRVEVLAGPQGTLFGASSQAGVVRLITNKPDPSGFFGRVQAGASTMTDGEANYNINAMLNIPLSDNFAIRGVVFTDEKGGYIDNVPGTRTAAESARFRPGSAVRSNGTEVGFRGGFQAGVTDFSNVTFLEANNSNERHDLVNIDPSGPHHRYLQSFDAIEPGTEFQVSLQRKTEISAPHSTARSQIACKSSTMTPK